MVTPFKIKWTQNIEYISSDISNLEILDFFKNEFEKTYCDKTVIIENSILIVRNEIIRLKPDFSFNIWYGISKSILDIDDESSLSRKTISYEVDFSKQTIISLLFIIFSFSFIFQSNWTLQDIKDVIFLLGFIFCSVLVFPLLLITIRQKMLFTRINKKLKTSYNPQ